MYTYILYRYEEIYIYIYIYLYEKGKRGTQEIPKISRKFTTSFVKILEERSFVVAINFSLEESKWENICDGVLFKLISSLSVLHKIQDGQQIFHRCGPKFKKEFFIINPLSANSTKWSTKLKQFVSICGFCSILGGLTLKVKMLQDRTGAT